MSKSSEPVKPSWEQLTVHKSSSQHVYLTNNGDGTATVHWDEYTPEALPNNNLMETLRFRCQIRSYRMASKSVRRFFKRLFTRSYYERVEIRTNLTPEQEADMRTVEKDLDEAFNSMNEFWRKHGPK